MHHWLDHRIPGTQRFGRRTLILLHVGAIWILTGYVSDALVHATFATIVGFMLGIREGSNVVSRTLTAFRNISSPPPVPPGTPSAPPPQTPVDPQEPS
jgi:ABC-type dipeptide/oligopeptide/nickel transport system permease subunit